MKVILEKEESEKMFHSALCNVAGCLSSCDLELDYSEKAYKQAKNNLQKLVDAGNVPHFMYWSQHDKMEGNKPTVCIEDVLTQILIDGGKLTIIDHNEGGKKFDVRLKDVHEKVQNTPVRHILDLLPEGDGGDCYTAFSIMQTVFLGEEVYG